MLLLILARLPFKFVALAVSPDNKKKEKHGFRCRPGELPGGYVCRSPSVSALTPENMFQFSLNVFFAFGVLTIRGDVLYSIAFNLLLFL